MTFLMIVTNFRPVGTDLRTGDFITETWFMALLISMVTVMVLLFAAMLLVRRRQMLAKKTMTPSRSNGAVLTTPLGLKNDAPLWLDKESLPEYASSTLPEYSKLTPQEYSRVDYNSLNGYVHQNGNVHLRQNPMDCNGRLPYNRKFIDYSCMEVQEYASANLTDGIADYAEVDPKAVEQENVTATSPAPYATTTLVTGTRRMGNSMVSSLLKFLIFFF